MDLTCPQHPKYKGLSDTKRDCDHCRRIRQAVLAAKRKKSNQGRGEQMSISTHGYRCGMVHLLAEIGTLMMFGPQPRFFWRKDSGSRSDVREYFQRKIKEMIGWQKRTPGVFREIAGLIWRVWGCEFQKRKAAEVLSVVEETHVVETSPDLDGLNDLELTKKNKSLDEILGLTGENDGKIEED